MLTETKAKELANRWIESWNSHDLDRIMFHYDEDVALISPDISKLLGNSLGTILGKPALRAYYKKGLEEHPKLSFQLIDVLWGLRSVVLYYINQEGKKTAEFMKISSTGRIFRVTTNTNG